MNIWILQTGEPLPSDNDKSRPMRAINLTDALLSRGHDVVIFSSAFYHQKKSFRPISSYFEIINCSSCKTILLSSSGYKKNIGIMRLLDHLILGFNLHRFLSSQKLTRPDCIIIGYPPIETAYVMSRFALKYRIPIILDVKDLWPQIFLSYFPRLLRIPLKCLLLPYFRMSDFLFKNVDCISSITDSFLNHVLLSVSRSRTKYDYVLPLVNPQTSNQIRLSNFSKSNSWWTQKGIDLSFKNRLIFIGTVSRAFDFSQLSVAMRYFTSHNIDLELVICGDGDQLINVQKLFHGCNNVVFPGWVNTDHIAPLMQSSLATVAPYRNTEDFIMSIPNKILDSFSYGLPVITGLKGEVRDLIVKYDVGFYCEEDPNSWIDAVKILMSNPHLRDLQSSNSLRLSRDCFDFANVYSNFCSHVEDIAKNVK